MCWEGAQGQRRQRRVSYQWAPPPEQIINRSDFPTIPFPAPQHSTAFCSSLFSLPSSASDLLVPRLSPSSQKLSFLHFVKNVVLTFATDWHDPFLFICWEQWFSNGGNFLPQGTLGKVWRYFWWWHWGKGVGYHWHLVGGVTDALSIYYKHLTLCGEPPQQGFIWLQMSAVSKLRSSG